MNKPMTDREYGGRELRELVEAFDDATISGVQLTPKLVSAIQQARAVLKGSAKEEEPE